MIFRVSESVACPPDQVWRYLTEPVLMSRWIGSIDGLATRDGAPLHADSELVFTARGAERLSHVTAFEPGKTLALRSEQGSFTATYVYRLAPDANQSRVTLEATCTARGMAKLLAPLVRLMIRMADRNQLVKLRQVIEHGT